MTIFKCFLLISILTYLPAKGQLKINEFSPEIEFQQPDSSKWVLVADELPSEGSKGVLMYKHKPIKDSLNRDVEPVIAFLYEKVNQNLDVIEYSINYLGTKPFKLRHELLGGYPEYSSDKSSVVFMGYYTRENVKHSVYLGYILNEGIGIEIICDATDQVFPMVKDELFEFLKSVKIIHKNAL